MAIVLENRRPAKQKSPQLKNRQMGKIERGLAVMSRDLAENAWCAGKNCTLADIACGAMLGYLDFRHGKYDWRVLHPNLARLAAKLAERPSFMDTIPRDQPVLAAIGSH